MNMFDGVVHQSGTNAFIEVKDLKIPFASIDAPHDTPIHMGARPEALISCPEGEAEFSTKVEVFEPLGSDTMVSARVADTMAVIRLSPETPVAQGMDLHLRFDHSKLHIFSADTGNRISATAL
jgi:ABC-type sugar transport system ATPase subunit